MIVTRLPYTDTCFRHPCFDSYIGQHIKESLKDTTMPLRFSHRIDGWNTLFPDASLIEFITCLHAIGYIHERYGIVTLSTKGIMDFLAEPLCYAIIDASLYDIITKVWMWKGNYHFHNRFLVQLLLSLCSFPFKPAFLLFFLFKSGIIVFTEIQLQILYLLFYVWQHLMFWPGGIKLLNKVDDITSIFVGTAKITPEILGSIDTERGCPFRTKWRTIEVIASFPGSLTIIIGSHPLKDADRLDFVYFHIHLW